ncbi:MAG: NAD(P)/FAD-dependent oxidoreductase [Anaerolineales bacterium]|nr:NAD(P)/FAD-dependent oxidoreductase [Anaerolineales bacterium]MCB9144399.1 NAD(P)/FAD-dependent oxidoreductase [Anaerolineales bacterium]
MRYAIIGTGVAGISAVEAIRSVDRAAEVVMVGDDPHGYYSRPGLAYVLTGEMQDKSLFPKKRDDYTRLKFNFLGAHVTGIDRECKTLLLDGKAPLTYDKLLIATGASAIPLTVPGANLQGVFKLDDLEDARNILKYAKRGRTAVVIGGGITALELTEGLFARGMNVHYLLRGSRYWSNVLDEHESRIVEGRLQAEGVELHFRSEVQEVLGRTGKVTGVRLLNGKIIKCDLVAYAIGIKPRLSLAQSANLAMDRGILVNEFMQTNDLQIYAAGDVAQAYDPLTGRSVLDSLWNPAREQGRIAGLNMAGQAQPYIKSAPFNVTRLAGLTTTIIGAVGHGNDEDIVGIARGDSETWRQLPDAIVAQSGFDVNRVRLLVGEDHLIGAVVMGDQKLSMPLQKIIEEKVNITSIKPKLLVKDARVADVIVDFWTNHLTAA